MSTYTIKIVKTPEELSLIESIRKEAFHLKDNSFNLYQKHIKANKIIPFALYKEDEMIGGCYIGEYQNAMYVYSLFLKENYQRSGEGIGRKFLLELSKYKKAIEALLKSTFEFISLHPCSDKLIEIYESIGFIEKGKGYYVKKI